MPDNRLGMPGSLLPKGTAFTRYVQALAANNGRPRDAAAYAEQWRDSPQVGMVLRAAVEAGSTATGSWAENLAVYGVMQNEWIELLRPLTILGRLSNVAMMPFNTYVQRVSGGITAQWTGADAPIPVTEMTFGNAVLLEPLSLATIVVLTKQLATLSAPSAEAIIRRDLLAGIAQYADQQFIDPTVTASAGVSAASITNTATSRASTGSSVAQITADAQALIAAALAGGCTLANAVWIMHPRSASYLSSALTAGNARMWPEVSVRGGSWAVSMSP